MTFQLSDRAKELIPNARIISFASWVDKLSPQAIARFQTADDRKIYLTDEDFAALSAELPSSQDRLQVAKLLRDRADRIVSQAREQVLVQFPGITDPGGDLYPPVRAQNCWRDFWHFLRCVTYGIAGGQAEFTDDRGLHYMELLYQELRVPLPAMIVGLENLKTVSRQEIADSAEAIDLYFDHLIHQLRQFQPE